MRRFRVPGAGPDPRPGLSVQERRKLVWMLLGLALVIVLIVTSTLKSRAYVDEGGPVPAPAEEAPAEEVALPEIDLPRLRSLVRDAERHQRVRLGDEALALLVDAARRMTPASFAAMETRELDAEILAEIEAGPEAFRGLPFTARGEVESLRSRPGPGGRELQLGRLRLEDGGTVHFATLAVEEPPSYARVDGFFLKLFARESEDEPGRWLVGPLLVGPAAARSWPSFGETRELDRAVLATVEDDSLAPGAVEVTGISFLPLWHLMDYARDAPPDAVDWDEAPELDEAMLEELLENGAAWRGRPFRIPISRLQGVRVRRADENPARIPYYTEGWIGNATWRTGGVVHFRMPSERRDLRARDYVRGRGWFLEVFAYESSQRGLRLAPVFVLDSLTSFVPEEDRFLRVFGYGVGVAVLLLAAVLVLLLRRDRRRSQRLHEDLVRRRRARRAAAAGEGEEGGAAPPPPSP